MGKRKAGKGYVHKQTHNPEARESEERRMLALKNLEIRRLRTKLEKLTQGMASYTEEREVIAALPASSLLAAPNPNRRRTATRA